MEFLQKIFSHSRIPKQLGVLGWVNGFEEMDDISAIEYSTKRLNEDSKKNIFQDDQYLEALFSIDEKTHIIVERITAHYINIDNMSIELEERISNAVFLYFRQQFLIYSTLIENQVALEPKPLLVMLARAIYNATQMLKWRYYKYQSAPANVWIQLSKLYLIAEKQSILDSYVRTYNNQEISTISSGYMQACMLGSLESLSFQRKQIDLVSKMLACWTPKILIQKIYDEKKHLFFVDTSSDAPAKRIRNLKQSDNCRYWCTDSINLKVELCLSLIEFNISPKQQEMKDFINDKYAKATLEILRTEWSRDEYKRQRRSLEREKTTKYATITFGFEDTCYHITQHENIRVKRGEKPYQGSKSFDERLASHYLPNEYFESNVIYMDLGAGQSKIIDESSQGIGMYINRPVHEVSLGMLVGISITDQEMDTKIGIIRSIKPTIGNELHIGIELLSPSAFCVEAENISLIKSKTSYAKGYSDDSVITTSSFTRNAPVNLNSIASGFTCLFLPKELTNSKQDTLLIPRLHYNKNDYYKINILGRNLQVKFNETLEHHDNWLRIVFAEVEEKKLVA